MNEKTLGPFAVAKKIGVTPTTVYRWIKGGKLPAHKTAGGHSRITESNLSSFLQKLKISTRPGKRAKFKPRILIVDDDLAMRRLIGRLIKSKFPGAEIHEAIEGYEAGFKTRELKPNILVLDFKLPGLNGVRICRLIKRDWNMRETKILAMTAYRTEKAKRVFARAGVDGFFYKSRDNQRFMNILASFKK